MRNRILLTFAIFLFFSCSSSIYEEEPNNTPETANFINFPFSLKGRLNNGMDIDYFKFRINNDSYCYFSISSLKGFDTQIEIFDSNNVLLKKVDDYPSNFGESVALFLKKGIYFIKVSPSPNDYKSDRPVVIQSDDYVLIGDLLSLPSSNIEMEPNDLIEQSNNISIGFEPKTIYGFYKPAINRVSKGKLDSVLNYVSSRINKDLTYQDIDVFNFTLKDKGSFLLNLSVNDLPNYDPVIIFFSENNFHSFLNDKKTDGIYFSDSNSYDRGEGINNLKIEGNNKYYIILTSITRLNYEDIKDIIKNPYSLNLSLQNVSNINEIEVNDNKESANIISSNIIKGFLNPASDIDYYVFNGDEASFISISMGKDLQDINYKLATVEIEPPKDIDISLEIYSDTGNLLKVIDNGGVGFKKEIPNLLLEKGNRVFLAVKGGRDNLLGNFKEEYIFKIKFNDSFDSNIEAEPNDENNQNVKYNTFSDSISGFVNNKGDLDNFYYLVPDTGKYVLNFENIEVPFIVTVYDFKNFIIKEIKVDLNNRSFELLIPTKQVIRISVRASDRNYFNTKKPYNITIKRMGE
ncbi:MAG TPA: hypothetical protein PKW55_06670 [Spirochaetota bacterium]|nr:hypothetical protein [Spirochaetota bacterium]HOM39102.1 hypothetical protein [Spirochaetota bacterium]HPQ49595.1 hypothetical protein [Spirochaetota bacterium]